MMVCQVRLEYLKQFNLDLVRVSCKVKMNQRHTNPGVLAAPKRIAGHWARSVSQIQTTTKELSQKKKSLKLRYIAPEKMPFWRETHLQPLDFQVQSVSLRELRVFSPKIQSWFWITEIHPSWSNLTNNSASREEFCDQQLASKEVSTTLSLPEAQAPQPLPQPWRVLWRWRTRCRRLVRLVRLVRLMVQKSGEKTHLGWNKNSQI